MSDKRAVENTALSDERPVESLRQARLAPGDVAPEFSLPNVRGESVSLTGHLNNGPVVLLFYRDGACPVCKAALRAYQRRLPTIQSAGARVIALSPESRDASLTTALSNRLDFEFLSDEHASVAGRFGVTYDVVYDASDTATERLPDSSLPVPASLIVNSSGCIMAAAVGHRSLLDPDEVVDTLRRLAEEP